MRQPLIVGVALALAAAACDGPDLPEVPITCSTDTDCPTGKGCFSVTSTNRYCSPLCDEDAQCPAKLQCPYPDLVASGEAPSCSGLGNHFGRGVCDLYEGSYGPANCASAPLGSPTSSTATKTGSVTATKTSTSTSTSCTLTKCSGSGFTYSCGSSSSTARTTYSYDSNGNRTGWTTTVSYSNGKSVTCKASGSSGTRGSCSGTGGASCSW